MPTDKRPPTSDDLTGWKPDVGPGLEDALAELATSELAVEGRLPWSSNLTFLVTVGGGPLRAVYKPGQGERTLWDFPGGLYRREVAAYALSEALGWGVVPPTVAVDDGPFGPGSVQLFVDADYEQHYFTLYEGGNFDDQLRAICAFDVVANNADRKSGHVLTGDDRHLWGIDHGLCFHSEPKLRTVMWDYAGDELPESCLADLEGLALDGLPDEVARHLTRQERECLVARTRALLHTRTYPEPEGDRHPYPWPLV